MGKVEICRTALQDKGNELLVLQVLFQDEKGDQLGDVVLQVISLLAAMDDGIYALAGQKIIDIG